MLLPPSSAFCSANCSVCSTWLRHHLWVGDLPMPPPTDPSQPGLGKLWREADLGLLVTLIHGAGDAPVGNGPLLSHSFAFHSNPPLCRLLSISVGCSWSGPESPSSPWLPAAQSRSAPAAVQQHHLVPMFNMGTALCYPLDLTNGMSKNHQTIKPLRLGKSAKAIKSNSQPMKNKDIGQGQCRKVKEGPEDALEKFLQIDRGRGAWTVPRPGPAAHILQIRDRRSELSMASAGVGGCEHSYNTSSMLG